MRSVEGKFSKIILCIIFALAIIIAPIMGGNSTSALNIVQHSLTVVDQSPTLVVHNSGIGNFSLTPRIEFNRLNDYITYKLAVGNQDGKKYQIVDVADNNTNDAIDLSYIYPTDLSLGDKEIELTIKYVKVATTPLTTVSITVKFIEESGATGQINLPMNYFNVPNTGVGTIPTADFVINENSTIIICGIFAVVGAVIYIRRKNYKIKYAKIAAITILLLALIPVVVSATISKDLQFKLNFADVQLNGPYTITFDTGSTSTIAPQIINHGDIVVKPQNPSKIGFTFKEWLDDNGQPYIFSQQVTKNHKLTARYEAINYSITYDLDGGSATNSNTYTIESDDITLNNPTKPGHTFIGWTGDNGTTPEMTVKIPQGSINDRSYTAHYQINSYTVTYNADGGKPVPAQETKNYQETFTPPTTNPTKTGYDFAGWLDSNNQPYDFSTKITGDLNLKAKYTPIVYQIAYDLDGGSVSNPATYTIESADITLNNPTKTGFDFLGWTSDNGVTVEQTVTIQKGSIGDRSYVAIWKETESPVTYHANGANSPTAMNNQIIKGTAATVRLWATNFQYHGHGFAGWNTKTDGTGTSYGPNQLITDPAMVAAIKNNSLILYAMWIASADDLQGWQGCSAMNKGDITALTDTRDGNTYAVAKLADGKCWMIENLRLSNTNIITGDPVVINSTNTDNPASGFTLNDSQAPDSGAWCNSRKEPTCIDRILYYAGNTQNPVQDMITDYNVNVYSYGNYYNWYTATAGTGTSASGSGNAAGSICPAGWHLPSGGSGGEYAKLDIALGGPGYEQSGNGSVQRWNAFPVNTVIAGRISSAGFYLRGSAASYWTSTPLPTGDSNFGNAYSLYSLSSVYPGDNYNNYKPYGSAVRCIAN